MSAAGYDTDGGDTTADTVPLFTLNPPRDDCARRVINRTGTPIATVTANRRYVLDWFFAFNLQAGYTAAAAAAAPKFYGATVKYTCTAPCVP